MLDLKPLLSTAQYTEAFSEIKAKNPNKNSDWIRRYLFIDAFIANIKDAMKGLLQKFEYSAQDVEYIHSVLAKEHALDVTIVRDKILSSRISELLRNETTDAILHIENGQQRLYFLEDDVEKQTSLDFHETDAAYTATARDILDGGCYQFAIKLIIEQAIEQSRPEILTVLMQRQLRLEDEHITLSLQINDDNVIKILMSACAQQGDFERFQRFLLKGHKPTSACFQTATDDVLGFLSYRPRRRERKTAFDYLNQVDPLPISRISNLIHDFKNTSSDDSSEDESLPDLFESIERLVDERIPDEEFEEMIGRDAKHIRRYNRLNKEQNRFPKEHQQHQTAAATKSIYTDSMRMILFRGIHRAPRIKLLIEMPDLMPSRQQLNALLNDRQREHSKRLVVLLVAAPDEDKLVVIQLGVLIELKTIDNFSQPLQNAIKEIRKITPQQREDLRRSLQAELSHQQLPNDGKRCISLSPDLQKRLYVDPNLVKRVVVDDSTCFLTQKTFASALQDMTTQFHTLENAQPTVTNRRYPTRLMQFFDDYTKNYSKLFNQGGIQQYGFELNPILSTALYISKAASYACGHRMIKSENSCVFEPKYRHFSMRAKHPRMGYVRIYLVSHTFYKLHGHYMPALNASDFIYQSPYQDSETELTINSMIPAESHFVDIPLFFLPFKPEHRDTFDGIFASDDSLKLLIEHSYNYKKAKQKDQSIVRAIKSLIWKNNSQVTFFTPLSQGFINRNTFYGKTAEQVARLRGDNVSVSQSSQGHASINQSVQETIIDKVHAFCQQKLTVSYPNGKPRKYHGVDHACSTAMWARILYGFGKQHLGDKREFQQILSNEAIDLLHLVCVAHDSGREGDGKDLTIWEQQSAVNFKNFSSQKNYPEALIDEGYHAIVEKDGTPVTTLFQLLLHDADCIEYLRCLRRGQAFEFERLYLYKLCASTESIELMHAFESLMINIARVMEEMGRFNRELNIDFPYHGPWSFAAKENLLGPNHQQYMLALVDLIFESETFNEYIDFSYYFPNERKRKHSQIDEPLLLNNSLELNL